MFHRLVDALQLPASVRVDRRVAKSLLSDNAARTAADRRRIKDDLEELRWQAALKPSLIGVPAFRDELRAYEEIHVLAVTTRAGRPEPLARLIHRAVPYPVLLAGQHADGWSLSLVHKRASQAEADRVVLEDDLLFVHTPPDALSSDTQAAFLDALALDRQPLESLLSLYEGWKRVVEALLFTRVTGRFRVSGTDEEAAARKAALADWQRIEKELATRRREASKERQLARQVALNQEIKRLDAALSAARAAL